MLPQNHYHKRGKTVLTDSGIRTEASKQKVFHTMVFTFLWKTIELAKQKKAALIWGYNYTLTTTLLWSELLICWKGRSIIDLPFWQHRPREGEQRPHRLRFNQKGILIRWSFGILFRRKTLRRFITFLLSPLCLYPPVGKPQSIPIILFCHNSTCPISQPCQTCLPVEAVAKWTCLIKNSTPTSCLTAKSFLVGENGSSFTEFSSTTMCVHLSSPTSR